MQDLDKKSYTKKIYRMVSRDKTDIEDMICERWVVLLIERSGLLNFETVAEDSLVPLNAQTLDTAEEALKCLCNITFHSEKARAYCANTLIVEGLIARMQHYNNMPLREGCMLYDMKLLFILTALRQDIKTKVKELDGMEHLTDLLYKMLTDTVLRPRVNVDTRKYESINDQYQAISCEVLKVQFNLIQQTSSEGPSDEKEEAMFLKLMPVLTGMLQASASSHEKLLELHSNVANLLTSVPLVFYQYLTPELKQDYCCNQSFDGKNMDALQALLALLRHRLQISMDNHNQYENLSPILTVLIKSASACRSQRRYMRRVVLPPLRDVSRRPERGNTLRNLLCRLLTTPVTTVRDLVAEYLFILCKEKVGRMVKYTGFGNAAGHLAQKGLLAGGRGGQYSSSSDDSDTEEYRLAEPNIDPVVGCTRPPRVNPFDGMSEEQKEYEAMRLVDMFDRMMRRGVVKPARIADDGRLEALQHVVQMLPGAVPGKEKPKSRSYYDDSD
ncbi:synembryn-A isoform X2 [Trichoplusia ni]|uniref:Synembryn-A isoform X2 n=1 Tax=Trichoplusia ni TaxID=7111 RepID=A0A7E5X1B4_TRINI|nr:synembryn-A isoform X2 [Trichoplusia ni]